FVLPGFTESELIQLAASLERGSEHPLAASVVSSAGERGINLSEAKDFQAIPGKGVVGKVDGRIVAVGNPKLFEHLVIDSTPLLDRAESLRREGQTAMLAAIDGRSAGVLGAG